jgi:hypothetical protein
MVGSGPFPLKSDATPTFSPLVASPSRGQMMCGLPSYYVTVSNFIVSMLLTITMVVMTEKSSMSRILFILDQLNVFLGLP